MPVDAAGVERGIFEVISTLPQIGPMLHQESRELEAVVVAGPPQGCPAVLALVVHQLGVVLFCAFCL